MAVGVILQYLWNAWNIRCLMIVSLGIQIILAYAAPHRRKATQRVIRVIVWSTYLLADWIALYVFGLIANGVRSSSVTPTIVNINILALWASFLLIHLGGPDTITAFSLDDNNLWLRHLTRLIGQVFIFSYIFLKTSPGNNLVVPTALVLMTGVVKYGEKAKVLFLVSLDNLRSSITVRSISQPPIDARNWDNYFFQRFGSMIIDIMPSPSELQGSRDFFGKKGAKVALEVISGELNLMFVVLYTKIMAADSKLGIFSRSIFYVNMVAALVLFCCSSKDQFDGVDVRITYCLLVGVFIVDISRGMMSIESDWASTKRNIGLCCHLQLRLIYILTCIPHLVITGLSNCFNKCNQGSWKKNMGAFNLLDSSFQKYRCSRICGNKLDKAIDGCGLIHKLDEMMFTKKNAFKDDLWMFIFDELNQRASITKDEKQARELYESKGESILEKNGLVELLRKHMEHFDYDKGVICWHIATEICYNHDESKEDSHREWSKTLSDYQMYLLIHRSKLMAPVVGIGHDRYTETCLEVKEIANKLGTENLKDLCTKFLCEVGAKDDGVSDHEHDEKQNVEKKGVYGDKGKSTLRNGCVLARELMLIDNNNKWKIIAEVWVEMLSYAAGHCRGDAHARAVSEGGELLTHVWLLMAHFGIIARWPRAEWCEPKSSENEA